MGKKIILVGKGGSGKDYFRKVLQRRGFKFGVTHTTRPPRAKEVDGVDCFFITQSEFRDLYSSGKFIEHDVFNNWYYGTTVKTFEESDVFTMTPRGISKLSKGIREVCTVIYLDIDEDVRRERLLLRDMPGDSTERRLEADRVDFENFTDFDIRITNPDF